MPTIELDERTVERLDDLKLGDESYDELVNELVNIYRAQEMTLSYGGDRVP
jgi:predicted CopG family antitoxin